MLGLGVNYGLEKELTIQEKVAEVQLNLFVYLFETDTTVSNITKSFEEALLAVLEVRLQEYDTPVAQEEAILIARNLVESWKAGKLSKEMIVKILKKEKKIK